jgi:superfamily II DNA or RNA helicase
LKQNERKQIIIGTYSLAHEGLDIPSLDTIILATPKSNIIQAVGRILRETTGKLNEPYVIDVVDHWGPIQYQFRKRKKYYVDTGFTFQNPISDVNPLIFIKE